MIVLGLPRAGAPVALALTSTLRVAPDILAVSKLDNFLEQRRGELCGHQRGRAGTVVGCVAVVSGFQPVSDESVQGLLESAVGPVPRAA